MSVRVRTRFATLLGALLAVVAAAHDARAQAWVPAKGEGAVSVAFQTLNVKDHIATTTRVDAGQIDTNILRADVSYGLTDRIAIDLSLPFVSAKYTGNRPHPGTDIDDGSYRSAVTDVHLALRYNLTRDGVVVTPYIGTRVPSHSYAFYGHAAPGLGLREVQVGLYAATLLERGVPGLFVAGRYGFGFVEQVLDISHNRSSADLEAGYFVTPAFRAFAMVDAQYTHGGIDFPLGGLPAVAPEFRQVHDQIQRVHNVHLGVGAAYSITDTFDIFGSFSRLVAGRNGHALNRGVTVGASWGWSRKPNAADAVTPSAPASTEYSALVAKKEGSLLRCICQKSGM